MRYANTREIANMRGNLDASRKEEKRQGEGRPHLFLKFDEETDGETVCYNIDVRPNYPEIVQSPLSHSE